jgi:hypothetical protein
MFLIHFLVTFLPRCYIFILKNISKHYGFFLFLQTFYSSIVC